MDNTKDPSHDRSGWAGKEHSGRNQLTPKVHSKTYLCNTCKDNQTEFATVKPVFICKEKIKSSLYMIQITYQERTKMPVLKRSTHRSHEGRGGDSPSVMHALQARGLHSILCKGLWYRLVSPALGDRATGSLKLTGSQLNYWVNSKLVRNLSQKEGG